MWSNVKAGPPDAILGVTERYLRDENPEKVNLGVGAYRDDDGKPFILSAVKEAERRIVELGLNKEYLPITGNADFTRAAIEFALGPGSPALTEELNATLQGISGTGSLRLGASFLAKFGKGKAVWLPKPTWPNHVGIFEDSGMTVKWYRYYDPSTCGFDVKGCLEDLSQISEGETVILHTCAHNPTGVDPLPDNWRQIGQIIKQRNLIPFFDMAYQGFASGDPDLDAWPLRYFVNDLRLKTVLLAQSFAKNMGLYGERVGAFSLITQSKEEAIRCMSQLKILSRRLISSSPLHGSRIAAEIFRHPHLRELWLKDLKVMAGRIKEMRVSLVQLLAAAGSTRSWSHITEQIGMFCFSGLSPEQVERLITEYSIYMTSDGRISIAALTSKNIAYVAQAMHQVTRPE